MQNALKFGCEFLVGNNIFVKKMKNVEVKKNKIILF